jgi:phospholipid transport system substrate-binding protein
MAHALRLVLTAALASAALTGIAAPSTVWAAPADPAAAKIDALDSALIDAMKAGKAAGAEGRFKLISPTVESAFDLPAMMRSAVGPDWTKMSADDQAALTTAYRRYAIANYAKNFDGYSGQKFVLSPDVLVRGPDKVVSTQLTGGGTDVSLKYRMRQTGDSWKVIDVYYNGSISQLATQRSDFTSTLTSGGAKALVAKLNAQSDKLLK